MFDQLKKKLANFSAKIKDTLSNSPVSKAEPAKKEETLADETEKNEIAESKKTNPPEKTDNAADDSTAKTDSTDTESTENEFIPDENEKAFLEQEKQLEIPFSKSNETGPKREQKKTAKESEKRRLKAKTGIFQNIKAAIGGKITIRQSQVADLLDELELALLEADVEQDTAKQIVSGIREKIVNQTVSASGGIEAFIKSQIRQTLLEIMSIPPLDLLEQTNCHKPLIILVLGPNGAGKTTSIAKLTHYFQKNGKKTVWAASDTFRPASIEQLEKHGQALNVRVIKHQYGADPAAVAFDAIASAKSSQTDVVLIDSAGRQETNQNLMKELQKIVKVAKPDLKIMVAESYSGQSLLHQAEEFDSKLGLDGFILTKLDSDPKGGTLISLCFKIKKPVLFLGTGQKYEDLEPFEPEKIADKIV